MNLYNKNIAVDFDGVIHSYEKGWSDGTIYGTPKRGAKQYLHKLKEKGFRIVIHTARILNEDLSVNHKSLKQLKFWLKTYEIPYDEIFPKVIAFKYIDDNAIEFDVNNDSLDEWKNIYNKIK